MYNSDPHLLATDDDEDDINTWIKLPVRNKEYVARQNPEKWHRIALLANQRAVLDKYMDPVCTKIRYPK